MKAQNSFQVSQNRPVLERACSGFTGASRSGWRHRFGGFQSGKTFLIDRLQLIEQLERVSSGEEVSFERDRRPRLAGQLEEARRLASGRSVRIETAAEARDRVLKDLPAGIHLKPGELRIEFVGAEDLLRHLFELSQAIVNDYGRFEATVEDARTKNGRDSSHQ